MNLAAFVGALLVLSCALAGCGSAPGGESTEEGSEAVSTTGPVVTLSCGASQPLGGDDFEEGLLALGCVATKRPYGAGTATGMFETVCPKTTTAEVTCPSGRVVTNIEGLVGCYANQAPIYSVILADDMCTKAEAPNGSVAVGWDPNCTGGGCAIVHVTL